MGLDMYLNATRFFCSGKDTQLARKISKLLGTGEEMRVENVKLVVGRWRKATASAIRGWFVDNVQDGEDGEHDVSREQLQALRDLCRRVLADPEEAENLLPTQSGSFSDSIDYSDDYFEDLRNTIVQIDMALALPDGWDFTFTASW